MGQRRAAQVGVGMLGFGLGGLSLIFAFALGCGGGDSGVGNAKLPDGVRSQAIEHEACDESGHKVETVDVNNDGKPDIRRVYDGAQEICRISDLNRDGKPDMFEYYDKTGQLRRREADYDDNGIVNAIEIYEGGKLVRSELDTTNQGKIDTWDTFDPTTGKRVKRERDATGDGRVDQWWTYNGDQVTIAMDKNGDGLPDPDAVITLGASGQAITPPEPGAPAAPTSPEPGAPAAPAAPAAPTSPEPPSPPPAASAPSDLSPAGDAGAPTVPHRGGAKR